ncbi:MAG: hypothetical protein WCC17_08760 [Candidatus Nitrosopolaris sp.]
MVIKINFVIVTVVILTLGLVPAAYTHPLADAQQGYQMGYAIVKFDEAYKYCENAACNFNQTNVKSQAYDTNQCNVGYHDGFYSTNSSRFSDYWFGFAHRF